MGYVIFINKSAKNWLTRIKCLALTFGFLACGNILHALEADIVCTRDGTLCTINNQHNDKITFNTNTFAGIQNEGTITGTDDVLDIQTSNITQIINNRNIIATNKNFDAYTGILLRFTSSHTLTLLQNNGLIDGSIELTDNNNNITTLHNTGIIKGGIFTINGGGNISTLNNTGSIHLSQQGVNGRFAHLNGRNATGGIRINISNYRLFITQDSTTFNNFSGYTNADDLDLSHLSIGGDANQVRLKDSQSRLILDTGGNFELNKDYSLDKLIVKQADGSNYGIQYEDNTVVSDLYSHLVSSNENLTLIRNGDNFRLLLDTSNNVASTTLLKSNVQSVGSLLLHTQSMVFSNKNTKRNNRNSIANNTRRVSSYQAKDFRENDKFYYKEDNLLALSPKEQRERIIRRNQVSIEDMNKNDNQPNSNQQSQANSSQTNYHFFFTPFVTHNVLNEKNGFGADGLNYGFISGFNGMLGESNTLGFHLGFSYGTLSGARDLISTDMTTMSLLLGLHYKLDLVYDMYIKIIGDFIYLLNDINYISATSTIKQKPNIMGFSGSVYYGKDFNFNSAGILGLELGVNYQGLQNKDIDFDGEILNANLLNLIYLDLSSNYTKVFDSGFGLNLTLGAKGLMSKANSKITVLGITSELDSGADKFLGYGGLGVSYLINNQVELDLSYLGSFGDKTMSNSGFFNIRVWW